MEFHDLLNNYCRKLNISQNDLAKASRLSPSVISRYLSGERKPALDSSYFEVLCNALSELADGKSPFSESPESIRESLENALRTKEEQYMAFVPNFNALVDILGIKIKDLASSINFDASFLYRVRAGERRPADLDHFCGLTAGYIVDQFHSGDDLKKVSELLKLPPDELGSKPSYQEALLEYLYSVPKEPDVSNMMGFLSKMENFDLEEYIQAIHFNDIKIPTSPVRLPISKYYYGLDEMRKAELDFFKMTAIGKSREPVFMYSDMPMADMADNMDFNKKWMFGIAALLRKGLHINMVHNLDRPFEELMLGFEAWIPIYMTGQVSPFHFPGYRSELFQTLNYVSGNASLSGECIFQHHSEGRYCLSGQKTDIAYMRKRTNAMLKAAKPLMDIYNAERADEFLEFSRRHYKTRNACHHVIASFLPLSLMPDALLNKIAAQYNADGRFRILDYAAMERAEFSAFLKENRMEYDYRILTREEFELSPPQAEFPMLFMPPRHTYTYEEYTAFVQAVLDFGANNPNFHFNTDADVPFRNIQIDIVKGRYFIVSKSKSPNIHFVIRHPKMLSAMENFKTARRE